MPSQILWSPDATLTSLPGAVAWTVNGLAAGQGRVSASIDNGAGDKEVQYAGVIAWNLSGVPALGDGIDLYISTTDTDGAFPGSSDLVGDQPFDPTNRSVDNFQWVNRTSVDQAATGLFYSSARWRTAHRFMRFLVVNRTSVAFSGTSNLIQYRGHRPSIQDPV